MKLGRLDNIGIATPSILVVPHLLIDDFLAEEDANLLLSQMLGAQSRFTPSAVRGEEAGVVDNAFRSSLRLPGRVGVELTGIVAATHARFDDICAATGVQPFPVYHSECSIVANRDGDFYRRHIDTGAAERGHVRVISCVYYLHRRPRVFTGGELAIYPVAGTAEATLIDPVHNRLVAFPSFFPHEVLPTASSGAFEDSRFSINIWLHRQVRPPAKSGE